jgi:hypothetical protein
MGRDYFFSPTPNFLRDVVSLSGQRGTMRRKRHMADESEIEEAMTEATEAAGAVALDITRFTPTESVQVLTGIKEWASEWINTFNQEMGGG